MEALHLRENVSFSRGVFDQKSLRGRSENICKGRHRERRP